MSKKSILKYLYININDNIIEDETNINFFSKNKIALRHFLFAIRKSCLKRKYKIILIHIDKLYTMGWAVVQEIRDILGELKSESTTLIAYAKGYDMKEYYIASIADEIILSPMGTVDVTGLKAEVYFIKNGLDKLGVEADFIKTGDYKTFADMFTRESISEAHRMMLNHILDKMMDKISQDINKSRLKLQESFLQLIDNAPYTSKEAQDAHLIDQLLYGEELEDHLKKISESLKCVKIPLKLEENLNKSWTFIKPSKKLGIVYASGNIVEKGQQGIQPSKNNIQSKTYIKVLRRIKKDKSIKGIVLRINSPGGSALESDIIWHEVMELKKVKPVVVSMSNVSASGGYYISMAGTSIFAQDMTLTGSIGVISGKMHTKILLEKLGIHRDIITKGRYADLNSITRPFTPEERDKLEQQVISFYYKQFLEKASLSRNMEKDILEQYAQGRVWTGQDGVENKLIDRLGGFMQAIEELKVITQIKNSDRIKYQIYPKKPFRIQFNDLFQDNKIFNPLITLLFESYNLSSDSKPLFYMDPQIEIE